MPHIHELIDYTTCAFIVHEGKVLMCKHKKLGKWLPIGGHIELDEDPDEGLFREIEEESGLVEKDLIPIGKKRFAIDSVGTKFLLTPNRLDIHDIDGKHRHVGLIYYFISKTPHIRLEEGAHDELLWVSSNELDGLSPAISPAVRAYCLEAIETSEV